MVREIRGRKFPSTSKENLTIKLIADVGDVKKEIVEENTTDVGRPTSLRIRNARVIRVMKLEWYNTCLTCKSKLIPDPDDDDLGECPKCAVCR